MQGTLIRVMSIGGALAVLAVAIAPSATAQGYTLTGAQMGNASTITMSIPKTGNTQTAHVLRLHFTGKSGSSANCTTGSLADYWHPAHVRDPVGVSMGYSRSAMGLPSNLTRTVAINVYSTAMPMTRQWTIVVPRGSCGGSNRTSTVTLHLVRAP